MIRILSGCTSPTLSLFFPSLLVVPISGYGIWLLCGLVARRLSTASLLTSPLLRTTCWAGQSVPSIIQASWPDPVRATSVGRRRLSYMDTSLRRSRSSEGLYAASSSAAAASSSSSASAMRGPSTSSYGQFLSEGHTYPTMQQPPGSLEQWRQDGHSSYNENPEGRSSGSSRGWLFASRKQAKPVELRRTKSSRSPVRGHDVLVDISTLCPPPTIHLPASPTQSRPSVDRAIPSSSTLVWMASEERWVRREEPSEAIDDSMAHTGSPRPDQPWVVSPTISVSVFDEDGDEDAPPSYVQSQLEEARRRTQWRRSGPARSNGATYNVSWQ